MPSSLLQPAGVCPLHSSGTDSSQWGLAGASMARALEVPLHLPSPSRKGVGDGAIFWPEMDISMSTKVSLGQDVGFRNFHLPMHIAIKTQPHQARTGLSSANLHSLLPIRNLSKPFFPNERSKLGRRSGAASQSPSGLPHK